MFSNWQQVKATAALVDEAQALADKLASAKPHFLESHSATAQFWAAVYLADGFNLHGLMDWKPQDATRLAKAADAKIATLRKQRDYASSDGLAIWMHTARAVSESRIAPAVREIWRHVSQAGPNADAMAEDLMRDAGLPIHISRAVPKGFQIEE